MLIAILRRVGLSLIIICLVAVLVFLATEVLPGDALDVFLTSDDLMTMEAEDIEALRHEYGLDKPAVDRFWQWFSGVVVGDFGVTFIDKTPVSDVIWDPLLNSLLLATVITLIAIPVALTIGILTGYYRGRKADSMVSSLAIIGYSIPDFVIGTLLIMFFAVWIPIFPALILVFADASVLELLKVSLMPAVTVIIGHVAHLSRLLRVGFIEAMNCEFVERARLSGIPEKRIVFRHALPASVIPSLNSMALFIGNLLSGLIVIEKVFGYPGLGLQLLEAVDKREVHVVQAITFLGAVLVIGMNLLADLAIIILDPRVRSHKHE
jgi:peptide/nickel transport system permease protein